MTVDFLSSTCRYWDMHDCAVNKSQTYILQHASLVNQNDNLKFMKEGVSQQTSELACFILNQLSVPGKIIKVIYLTYISNCKEHIEVNVIFHPVSSHPDYILLLSLKHNGSPHLPVILTQRCDVHLVKQYDKISYLKSHRNQENMQWTKWTLKHAEVWDTVWIKVIYFRLIQLITMHTMDYKKGNVSVKRQLL